MKKVFITGMPLQKVEPVDYQVDPDCELVVNQPTAFSILPIMKQKLESEEQGEVIVILPQTELSKAAYEQFQEEMEQHQLTPSRIKIVKVDAGQSGKAIFGLLDRLLDAVDPDSEVYVSLDYGAKITTLVTVNALQILAKVKRNIDIAGMYYGEAQWDDDSKVRSATIYDVSALYDLADIAGDMENDDPKDAQRIIKALLALRNL